MIIHNVRIFLIDQPGLGWTWSERITMKAYANGLISRQYFFDTNYFHLLLGLRSFQKSAFLKLTILFCHYFWCQIWDQWHKLSGKNTHIFFFYFLFKNKRVWSEIIWKKQKKSKDLKVAGNCPSIYIIHKSFSNISLRKSK